MKTLQKSLILIISTLIVMTLAASSDKEEEHSELISETVSFVVNGTITNGHPDLSWSSYIGADFYTIDRLPVPATGYSWVGFSTSGNSFLDEWVEVIQQSGGFCQIRYVIKAKSGSTELARAVVDFITAPDPGPGEPGDCNP